MTFHPGIAYGCDYNPEQWGQDTWREDVVLMREAGVDLVAINIFGWAQLEPAPGEYDFTDLDTIVALLHDSGVRINLGTGTASPPPWLTTLHPEILPEAEDGTTRYSGGRQAWCPSSPVFREHALALVEKVAERYGRHPAVALWHVSNELGCHNALCYDDDSAAAFRRWLEAKYGTIDALNRAWGTTFWSQRYTAWPEVGTPRLTLSSRNPGQMLDFHRFSSDELLGYFRAERRVIRKHSTVPITTNFMVAAHIRNLDYWTWAPEMDVIANDHYLDHRLADPEAELAFAADLTRGLAGGAPWLLMEHSTGAVNWQPRNLAKVPGEMTRNSLTHVARGADAVCFFQWRASRQGSEKFHSAMVPHAGTDTEVWREVVALGATLDRLGEVQGTTVVADVAMLFSWEAWWAGDGESRPSHDVRYLDQVHSFHAALRELGVTVDLINPAAASTPLTPYRLIIAPALYLLSDASAARLNSWVAGGGHLMVSFFSGIVDDDDRVRLGGYPGAFRETLGISVEEFVPLRPGHRVRLDNGGAASLWTERLRTTGPGATTTGAETIARYLDGPLAGVPAITRTTAGAGTAWYVATALDPASLRDLLRTVCERAGATALGPESDGTIEVIRRAAADRSYLFVINHGGTAIDLAAFGHELVTGEPVDRTLRVPAGAVRVLREDTTV
jgi:beta-galactosidase